MEFDLEKYLDNDIKENGVYDNPNSINNKNHYQNDKVTDSDLKELESLISKIISGELWILIL